MNETLKNLWAKLIAFWNRFEQRQRRNILISMSLLLVCFVAVLWVLLRPHYVAVMSGLDASSLGDAETQLQTMKIPYELQGSSVLVPKREADQARIQLATAGLPKSGYIGYGSVSSSFGMTQDQFNIQVLDALQQSLNQTIKSINGVQDAQVHIVMPEQQLFVSDSSQNTAKASVFVQLGTGVQLSSAQVAGIQQLVAHSVKGLSTDNVSVVDQNGQTLSQAGDTTGTSSASATTELGMRTQLEQQMHDKLTSGIAQITGAGNAVIVVHANVTFNQTESTTKNVLPAPGQTGGLIKSQTTSRTTSNSGSSTAGGAAGQSTTNPNLPSYSGSGNGAGGSTSSTTNQTTTYANGQQTVTTIADPIQLNGYSVGVVLNSQDKALNAQVRSQIKQFVSNAIGGAGSTNTANSVSVTSAPFHTQAVSSQPGHSKTLLWGGIAAAILALLGVFLLLRRRRPRADEDTEISRISPIQEFTDEPLEQNVNEDEQMRRQLANLASQKPDEFANLVRTWLVGD